MQYAQQPLNAWLRSLGVVPLRVDRMVEIIYQALLCYLAIIAVLAALLWRLWKPKTERVK